MKNTTIFAENIRSSAIVPLIFSTKYPCIWIYNQKTLNELTSTRARCPNDAFNNVCILSGYTLFEKAGYSLKCLRRFALWAQSITG